MSSTKPERHCGVGSTANAREVIADFSEQFDVTSEQIEKDFDSLVEDLLSIKAIEEAPPCRND